MAFTVEDGTGVTGANSYQGLTPFRDHHTDRGVITASYTDSQVQGALVQASDYIDKRFGKRFRGMRRKNTQGLEWPRIDAQDNDDYPLDGVPSQLAKATNEYALLALQFNRNLAPPPGNEFSTVDPPTGNVTTQAVKAKTEQVGPIQESTEYGTSETFRRPMTSTGNMIQRIPEYPQADLWVEELLESSSNRRLVRG